MFLFSITQFHQKNNLLRPPFSRSKAKRPEIPAAQAVEKPLHRKNAEKRKKK